MPLAGLKCLPRCSVQSVSSLALAHRWHQASPLRRRLVLPGDTPRLASWKALLNLKSRPSSAGETPENEEEVAKAAILEKVMKGRLPADLMLRCTILDEDGAVKTISGQFRRSDLCNEHRLNPRDLRKIDSRIPNLVPTILIRKEAILINILHIRALVKADTVHNLKVRGGGSPYEFRAIESILLSVLSALEAEMVFIRNLVGGLLAELEDDINHDKRLASFKNRARLVQDALEEVLEQDDDLNAMYLTDKKKGAVRQNHEHDELEVLLEFFSKQVEEIVNEAENIESNVQSTQEIVELILDSNRNALLALDLKVSILTMGLGSGALVAGLFGMNLQSHLEEMPYAFAAMTVVSACYCGFCSLGRLARIRKVGLTSSQTTNRVSDPKSRAPWIPLPLRRRTFNGWS
ncbi:hypothetical protein BKA83DRAFT_4285830 [Pisolithus microcarpus]|nr:hypothetical protein BKA83DRAFT_4285830 [Pisolithus microcarpus]